MNHLTAVNTRFVLRSSLGLAATGLAMGLGISAIAARPESASSFPQSAQQIAQAQPAKLTLVSYAVTKSAYANIIPKFVADWKAKTGQDVTFEQSYAGSGTQTRAVIDGLEADVVQLALAGDVKKIEKAGLIQPGWEKEVPNDGIVTRSVIAIVTRQGNPKKIQKWADLTKPDVKFITANPKTSGGAKWNFLGLWGSVTQTGGTDAQAQDFVSKAYKNVPVLPKDARESSDVFFKQGQGDALLNYENEVILAGLNGEKNNFYVVPQVNISIDAPVAVVDKNVDKHGTRKVAEAFTQFLYTPEAQREFAKVGFRPVVASVEKEVANKFPKVTKLFTVKDFGGWSAIDQKFFADGGSFDKTVAQR